MGIFRKTSTYTVAKLLNKVELVVLMIPSREPREKATTHAKSETIIVQPKPDTIQPKYGSEINTDQSQL